MGQFLKINIIMPNLLELMIYEKYVAIYVLQNIPINNLCRLIPPKTISSHPSIFHLHNLFPWSLSQFYNFLGLPDRNISKWCFTVILYAVLVSPVLFYSPPTVFSCIPLCIQLFIKHWTDVTSCANVKG